MDSSVKPCLLENRLKFCLLILDRKIQEYNQDLRSATGCCTEPMSQHLTTSFSCTKHRVFPPSRLQFKMTDFKNHETDVCFTVR